MEYLMLTASVIMFGVQFFFNDVYVSKSGNSQAASYAFMLGYSVFGLIALLIISGFQLEYTPFTLLMAAVSATNGILCGLCSMKALSRINLSLFSLFNMLGGMVLPFIAGILFFGEDITLAKCICLAFIFASMFFMFEKNNQKGGTVFYIGIFIFNGLSGVIATTFEKAPYAKADSESFSIWAILWSIGILLALFAALKEKRVRLLPISFAMMGGYGILTKVANLLLLLALAAGLPSSAQYPFVTGGVIVVSALLAYFTPRKPRKKDLIATALSFAGIIALVAVPI